MTVANSLLFQNFSTVQSEQQPQPNQLTAAATVAPSTFFTTISGTTAIATITPPLTNQHMLAIMPLTTNFAGFLSSGNIAVASITNSTTWGTRAALFIYDPRTAKYYPCGYPVTTTNT
jgi:hypothetical protein